MNYLQKLCIVLLIALFVQQIEGKLQVMKKFQVLNKNKNLALHQRINAKQYGNYHMQHANMKNHEMRFAKRVKSSHAAAATFTFGQKKARHQIQVRNQLHSSMGEEEEDEFDAPIQAEYFVKTTNSISPEPAVNFDKQTVKVNKNGVVFYTKADDPTQVEKSISMTEQLLDGDDIQAGICCEVMSLIEGPVQLKLGDGTSSGLYCFSISPKNDDYWQICDINESLLEAFRSQIKIQTIQAALREQHLPPIKFITNSGPAVQDNWTWAAQDGWKGDCSDGQFQSPIALESGEAKQTDSSLQWKYLPANDATATYNGHEIVIEGTFGDLSYKSSAGEELYSAQSIVFKFPAEHSIDGKFAECEMQVKHTTSDGHVGILSVFLEQGDPLTVEQNSFLEALFPESWQIDDNRNSVPLDNPNLTDIQKNSDPSTLSKGFFKYEGSLTTPPCSESVTHFVMTSNVQIQTLLMLALKKYAYDNSAESDGNVRKIREPGAGQLVERGGPDVEGPGCGSDQNDIQHQIEKAVQAKLDALNQLVNGGPVTKYGPPPGWVAPGKEGQAPMNGAEAGEEEDAQGSGKYIKTSADIKQYWYIPKDQKGEQIVGQLRDDFKIQEIDAAKLTPDVQAQLAAGQIVTGLSPLVKAEVDGEEEEGDQEEETQEKQTQGEEEAQAKMRLSVKLQKQDHVKVGHRFFKKSQKDIASLKKAYIKKNYSKK